jgi:hypothetical protein
LTGKYFGITIIFMLSKDDVLPKNLVRRNRWMENIPQEEQDLLSNMVDYEEKYFKDLTLRDGKYIKRLTEREIKVDGKWEKQYENILGDYNLSLTNYWIVKYSKNLHCDGKCIKKFKTIKIKKGGKRKEIKITLLHEMIHAYIMIIPKKLQEFLLIDMYEKLKKKLTPAKLNKIIDTDTHKDVTVDYAGHTLLFLFKSLLLDINLKEPLGTVYAYGREDYFKKYNSILGKK